MGTERRLRFRSCSPVFHKHVYDSAGNEEKTEAAANEKQVMDGRDSKV